MRSLHFIPRALLLLLLAVGEVSAQPTGNASKTIEFADRLQIWRQAQDLEERILVGEELLARESELAAWPLSEPQEKVRAELRFVVGSAYAMRPRGVRADNLESAIGHLKVVLGIWTREADTQAWARVHNDLGIAYWGRIRGERADNQETAIAHFEAALTVFTRDGGAREWAQLQNNLAIVYWSRIRGERARTWRGRSPYSRRPCRSSRGKRTPTAGRQAQNNLAIAYRNRLQGEQADNREKAIAAPRGGAVRACARQLTLRMGARAEQPRQSPISPACAATRRTTRRRPSRHLEAALTVFTRDGLSAAMGAGAAEHRQDVCRPCPGRADENRQKAIASFEAALSVFTRDTVPLDHLETSRLLGAHADRGQRVEAGGASPRQRARGFPAAVRAGVSEEPRRARSSPTPGRCSQSPPLRPCSARRPRSALELGQARGGRGCSPSP